MKPVKKEIKIDDVSITVEIVRQTTDQKEFKKYMKELNELEKVREKIERLKLQVEIHSQREKFLEAILDAYFTE